MPVISVAQVKLTKIKADHVQIKYETIRCTANMQFNFYFMSISCNYKFFYVHVKKLLNFSLPFATTSYSKHTDSFAVDLNMNK